MHTVLRAGMKMTGTRVCCETELTHSGLNLELRPTASP